MTNKTKDNVISFSKDNDILTKLIDKSLKEEDYVKALNFMKDSFNVSRDYDTLIDIAQLYSNLGAFDLSNDYSLTAKAFGNESVGFDALNVIAYNFLEQGDILGTTYCVVENMSKLESENGNSFLSDEVMQALGELSDPPEDVMETMTKMDISLKDKTRGEFAFKGGNYEEAILYYNKVPRYLFDEVESSRLSYSYAYCGMEKEMLDESRFSNCRYGENALAFTPLAEYYFNKGNLEKCEYYYSKACELVKETDEDYSCLFKVALLLKDDENVINFGNKILESNAYDYKTLYLTSVAYINVGDYDTAEKNLNFLLRFVPEYRIYKFYSRLVRNLKNGDVESKKLLPLDYKRVLPKSVIQTYHDVIDRSFDGKKCSLSDKRIMADILEWGVESQDDTTMKRAVYLLSQGSREKAIKEYNKILLSSVYSDELKVITLYTIMMTELKKSAYAYSQYRIAKINFGKMDFLYKDEGERYVLAYAVALMSLVSFGGKENGKLVAVLNLLYQRFKDEISNFELDCRDIAAIGLYCCNIKNVEKPDIKRVFGKKYENIKITILDKLKGEL